VTIRPTIPQTGADSDSESKRNEWPHNLPASVRERAYRVAAMLEQGESERAIAKRLGLRSFRVAELLIIHGCLEYDRTGVITPHVQLLRDIAEAIRE
jgi:hypothetical protein